MVRWRAKTQRGPRSPGTPNGKAGPQVRTCLSLERGCRKRGGMGEEEGEEREGGMGEETGERVTGDRVARALGPGA